MSNPGNIENDIASSKRPRGWHRRGFKWDKNSPEYKEYRRRYAESMSKKTRKRLEALAKRPLPGRVYKHKLKN